MREPHETIVGGDKSRVDRLIGEVFGEGHSPLPLFVRGIIDYGALPRTERPLMFVTRAPMYGWHILKKGREKPVGLIKTDAVPRGTSIIFTVGKHASWPTVSPLAEAIILKLQERGFKRMHDKTKGGRPRNLDDNWAWTEVREKHRTPKEVYPEWLQRIGDRAKSLAQPRDTFNKAISPKRKKTDETD